MRVYYQGFRRDCDIQGADTKIPGPGAESRGRVLVEFDSGADTRGDFIQGQQSEVVS